MAAVVNCSRRLLTRPSATALVLLPIRPRSSLTSAAAVTQTAFSATHPTNASTTPSSASFFSTSASALAKGTPQHIRAGKKTQNNKRKKKNFSRGKAIAPGERKAFRKRIVLSNSNALEVPGLEELTTAHLLGAAPKVDGSQEANGTEVALLDRQEGQVLALPDALIDQLRTVEAFKPTQQFSLFRRPSLIVRNETVALISKLQREAVEEKKTLRIVIDGKRVAGKSTLLLHAMTYGFMNDWLVFNIPEGQELTTACTDYAAVPGSDPVQYIQPTYTFRLLQALATANNNLLGRLKTARDHNHLTNPVAAGSTLLELVGAAKEADNAWPVFQSLWQELTDPDTTLPRPPVLFSLDGLAHIMRVSDYRSPTYERIHAHDLLLVRLFVDALGGAAKFPQGAAILAATTRGNSRTNPSMELALAQRRIEQAKDLEADEKVLPSREPYKRGYDDRVEAALRTVEVFDLEGLSKAEARSLLEYWAASGVLRDRVTEQTVAAMWTLAGNGLVGEMERTTLLSLRT